MFSVRMDLVFVKFVSSAIGTDDLALDLFRHAGSVSFGDTILDKMITVTNMKLNRKHTDITDLY